TFKGAQLTVEASGKTVHQSTLDLSPEKPFAATITVPRQTVVSVAIRSAEGRELIRYRTDAPIDGNPEFQPATRRAPDPAVPSSAEQAYVTGLAADKKSNEPAARAAYHTAIQLDPGFAPAHVALGVSFYRTGEYERAAEHLEAALRRNPDSGDAHYYLA